MEDSLIKALRKHVKKIIILSIFLLFSAVAFVPFLYPSLFYSPPGKKEVVIIGLEGASWRVIKPMIDKGELPNFKFLIENGAYGTVNSSILSNEVWLHIAGRDKSFWKIAAEKNKTVVSLYWPDTAHNKTLIYDLKGSFFLENPLSEFFKKMSYLRILIPVNKADKDLLYDFYLLDRKMREFFYSREKLKPDVSGIIFSDLPRLQLYYWAYMEHERFQSLDKHDVEKYGGVIEEYYKEVDSYLGKLIAENVTVVILSGYGFDATIPQKVIDKILVNKILELGGLLSFDYRGEIDFSKTKAYSLEEGLEEETTVYINPEEKTVKSRAIDILSKVYIDGERVFDVSESKDGLTLRRKVPPNITSGEINVLGKIYPVEDFVLRRIVSGRTTEEGILIMYGDRIKRGEIRANFNDIAQLIVDLI
jgi:hypothetical protein